MKVLKRTIYFFLILALFAGVLFGAPLTASGAEVFKDITLQPGSSERMMNFCWQSTSGATAAVQIAEDTGLNATAFPSDAMRFEGSAAASTKGFYANNVTVTGLSPETAYLYRVGNGTAFSGVYRFRTGSGDRYNAIFVSDAQIGASGSVSRDRLSWEKTLTGALGKFPGTSFLLSAGDQVDYYLQSTYDAFLFSPLLRTYPMATAVGNHENISNNPLHSYYYNEPNESPVYGRTPAGGDYWFRYGGTLYLVLNTNNTNVSEHEAFIDQAVTASPNAGWTILMFHQSVYSSASHSADTSIVKLRSALVPVIDRHHIDVVLSGHDHCYTRTYQMLGGSPVNALTADAEGRVVNPAGTVYITANSSSGSKYYDMKTAPEAYAAVRLQLKVPTFMNIEVSADTLTMTTYRADTMAPVDTYAIVKQNASGFNDVPDGAWYSEAVAYLSSRGITDGTSKTTFSPDMTLTRGQCLVFIMKAYGLMPEDAGAANFADAGSTWYTGYLAAAKRLGLAKGAGNNSYLPEALISQQDMFVLLYNTLIYLGKLPGGSAPISYSDDSSIADYAQTAIAALSASGVVTGSGGYLDPLGISTRAQMAQVLYKLLQR